VTLPDAKPLRLGLHAWEIRRTGSIEAFAARLDATLAAARGRADLLVLPEYAAVELGTALSRTNAPDEAAELRAMVEHADGILAAMRGAAMRAGTWLLAGSLPMRDGDRVVNRAPLIAPDGRLAFQEKLAMTRFEDERWGVSRGADPQVFDTPWGRIGVSVCYDVEFPKHVRAQVEAGAWLVLVPVCTDSAHGVTRINVSAAARAIENQCFVAVTPTVGEAPWSAALDVNRGRACVFGPADRGFEANGEVASLPMDQPGWLFAELDPARIARVREEGAVRNHRDWPRGPVGTPEPARFL
jgi:predicted amidohydrolase